MTQKVVVQICLGSSCFARGNKDIVMFIKDYVRKNHLEDRFIFRGSRCMGNCSNGPNLKINEELIEGVNLSVIEGILEKELSKSK
jgi:NADH:ubiquinone oxidoreductase subunit E